MGGIRNNGSECLDHGQKRWLDVIKYNTPEQRLPLVDELCQMSFVFERNIPDMLEISQHVNGPVR